MIKTSISHPLRIDAVKPLNADGMIGMTFCPGKKQCQAMSGGDWDRDLDVDIEAMVAWGASTLLCLIEDHELVELQVQRLAQAAEEKLAFFRLPIVDGGIPDDEAEDTWASIGADLREKLSRGERIVIHCKGGLGRTGLIAARLLIELGEDPQSAIRRVRTARRGAIETDVQEQYLMSKAWK